MSKIICDICGTVYPDNAPVCPICGYPHRENEKTISDQSPNQVNPARDAGNHVKGGKFSSRNVKKRHEGDVVESIHVRKPEDSRRPDSSRRPENLPKRESLPKQENLSTQESLPKQEDLQRQESLPRQDRPVRVENRKNPEDPRMVENPARSENIRKPEGARRPELPRKSEKSRTTGAFEQPGRVKAGPGLKAAVAVLAVAVIGVSGYIAMRFVNGAKAYDQPSTVQTDEPVQTDAAVTESAPAPTEIGVPCVGLSVSDEAITFDGAGRAWILAVETVPENATGNIAFTSSNETVATVDAEGRVTSVGPGQAIITITCGDIIRQCQVSCNFDGPAATTAATDTTDATDATDATDESNQMQDTTAATEPNQNGQYKDNNWKLNNEYGDVTLILGEEFSLELHNDAGETANVTWKADRDGVVSINGNAIKGEYVGMVDVTTTIDGKTYTCIVRVIESRQ